MALKSIAGSLAAGDLLDDLATSSGGAGALRGTLIAARRALGPASTARQIFDLQLQPLLHALALDVTVLRSDAAEVLASFGRDGTVAGTLSAAAWGGDLRRLRDRAAHGGARGARWWIGGNGASARLMDVSRAYARRTLDFDLLRLEDDERGLAVMQRLFDAAPGAPFTTLHAIVTASDRHSAAVGQSLQAGVEDALSRLTGA